MTLVARLKVTLSDVEPQVLRRFDVPLKIKLNRLHDVIQAAMGWTDSHLSADGTGTYKTYARRRGAARSVASRNCCVQRAACHDSDSAATLPDSDRATSRPPRPTLLPNVHSILDR